MKSFELGYPSLSVFATLRYLSKPTARDQHIPQPPPFFDMRIRIRGKTGPVQNRSGAAAGLDRFVRGIGVGKGTP